PKDLKAPFTEKGIIFLKQTVQEQNSNNPKNLLVLCSILTNSLALQRLGFNRELETSRAPWRFNQRDTGARMEPAGEMEALSAASSSVELRLGEILELQGEPVTEEQAWALCYQLAALLSEGPGGVHVQAGRRRVLRLRGAQAVVLSHDGSISLRLEDDTIDDCFTCDTEDKICRDRLYDPDQAPRHYKDVCCTLFSETVELCQYRHTIQHTKEQTLHKFVMDPETRSVQITTDWMFVWKRLVEELSRGMKLRPSVDRLNLSAPLPVAHSPSKQLLADIQLQRFKLRKVEVGGHLCLSVPFAMDQELKFYPVLASSPMDPSYRCSRSKQRSRSLTNNGRLKSEKSNGYVCVPLTIAELIKERQEEMKALKIISCDGFINWRMRLPFKGCMNLPVSFFKKIVLSRDNDQGRSQFWKERWSWDYSRVPLVLECQVMSSLPLHCRAMRDWYTQDICVGCKGYLLDACDSVIRLCSNSSPQEI
ncbi:protein spire1-like, partial [Scleropages formosus]